MPRYNDLKKYYCRCMESDPSQLSSQNKEKEKDGLIIEDNTIYEIDIECIEKVNKNRINERNERYRKYK